MHQLLRDLQGKIAMSCPVKSRCAYRAAHTTGHGVYLFAAWSEGHGLYAAISIGLLGLMAVGILLHEETS